MVRSHPYIFITTVAAKMVGSLWNTSLCNHIPCCNIFFLCLHRTYSPLLYLKRYLPLKLGYFFICNTSLSYVIVSGHHNVNPWAVGWLSDYGDRSSSAGFWPRPVLWPVCGGAFPYRDQENIILHQYNQDRHLHFAHWLREVTIRNESN